MKYACQIGLITSYLQFEVHVCTGTVLVKAARDDSSGGKATGEKGPATEPETVTYVEFSHTSYRISHAPSSPIAPYVPAMSNM